MLRRRMQRAPVIYALIMILLCFGYAKWDSFQIDGDAISFMDIADAIRTHTYALVPNGYWNPGYAAVLALGESIAHPTRWTELASFYWINWVIAVACILAMFFFVRSLLLARQALLPDDVAAQEDGVFALSPPVLSLAALALLFTSFQREFGLGAVRSDALLFLLFLIAGSCMLRLVSSRSLLWYPLLGAALGCAYLTKSFAFLPSFLVLAGIFLFGVTRKGSTRVRMAGGAVLAGIVFLVLAVPYIHAISEQRGRLTIGDSGRMNYAFDIDLTDRWHEAYTGRIGHATAHFKHPDHVILKSPAIYAYDQHPVGTYPPWFDPAYWADGLEPHPYFPQQMVRLVRNTELLLRYLFGRLEVFVLLGVLLAGGCFFTRRRRLWAGLLPLITLGVLIFAIYMLVDLQDRYMTTGFTFIMLPLLAALRRPDTETTAELSAAVVLLLAGVVAVTAVSDLAERRRQLGNDHVGGPYDKDSWEAAKGLEKLGITPGTPVACMGEAVCVRYMYWARLARTPIRAQIAVEPETGEAGAFWRSVPNQDEALAALRQQGLSAVVAMFAPTEQAPKGWHQLESSNYYAYLLQTPPGAVPAAASGQVGGNAP